MLSSDDQDIACEYNHFWLMPKRPEVILVACFHWLRSHTLRFIPLHFVFFFYQTTNHLLCLSVIFHILSRYCPSLLTWEFCSESSLTSFWCFAKPPCDWLEILHYITRKKANMKVTRTAVFSTVTRGDWERDSPSNKKIIKIGSLSFNNHGIVL